MTTLQKDNGFPLLRAIRRGQHQTPLLLTWRRSAIRELNAATMKILVLPIVKTTNAVWWR